MGSEGKKERRNKLKRERKKQIKPVGVGEVAKLREKLQERLALICEPVLLHQFSCALAVEVEVAVAVVVVEVAPPY